MLSAAQRMTNYNTPNLTPRQERRISKRLNRVHKLGPFEIIRPRIERKPPRPHVRCVHMLNPRQRCFDKSIDGLLCLAHGGVSPVASLVKPAPSQCHALTKAGARCTRRAKDKLGYCGQHGGE
jgi:hypothetical protein